MEQWRVNGAMEHIEICPRLVSTLRGHFDYIMLCSCG